MGSAPSMPPPPELAAPPEPPEVPDDPAPFIEEARLDDARRRSTGRARLRIPTTGTGSGMNYGG